MNLFNKLYDNYLHCKVKRAMRQERAKERAEQKKRFAKVLEISNLVRLECCGEPYPKNVA